MHISVKKLNNYFYTSYIIFSQDKYLEKLLYIIITLIKIV